MSIAQKIQAANAAIAEKKNELSILATQAAEGQSVDAEVLETLTKSIETDMAMVKSLENAESILMSKSAPAFIKNKAAGEFSFAKSALASMKAKVEGTSVEQAATEMYGADSGTVAVVKSATAPGTTTAVGWAAELIKPAYESFLEQLYPVAILPQLAAKGGRTLNFDMNGTVILPYSDAHGSVSGAFIGEGGSIPVKATTFKQQTIKQAKLGVISVFTRELISRSAAGVASVEALVNAQIIKDTAAVLDATAFGTAVASATVPAGLLAGVTGTAAAGVTAADIVTAVKAELAKFDSLYMTGKIAMIVSPKVARGLSLLMSATGSFIFAAEIASGRFLGMDLIVSQSAPADSMTFVNTEGMAFGLAAPTFTTSDSAALQLDTLPATGAAVNSSLFQQDLLAVRMIAFTAWANVRTGGVGHVTGLAAI